MKQKTLAGWLRAAIIAVAIFGLFFYCILIPTFGQDLAFVRYPEFSYMYLPWLIFLSLSAIPCYGVLVLAWLISVNIANDRSFSMGNAKYLKLVAILAAADSIYIFVGDVVLFFAGLNHPGVAIAILSAELIGIPITIAAASLSHLVRKAAALQEQSDLTI